MKPYLSKLLENGIILAIVTSVVYYLTYLSLDGVLTAYALPNELIEIDVPDIIDTLVDLIYMFWQVLVIPAVGLIVSKMWKDAEIVRLWRFSIIMITAVVFSIALLNRFEAKNWILLGIVAYQWADTFVKMMIHSKQEKTMSAKWANYKKKLETAKTTHERVAMGIGYLAVVIAIMYVLSGAVMEHAAHTQLNRESYLVARDYGDKVLIYENGTSYVLMARDGSQLLPEYQIVRYDHIGKLDYVHTGVLSLPDSYPKFD